MQVDIAIQEIRTMTREQAVRLLKGKAYVFYGEKQIKALGMAIEALEQEPIIYCKDCKYWQDNNNGYPVTDCRWNKDETPDANDYCSYAEKNGE